MKTCPYCASEIANNVKKCKYCGEWVGLPKQSRNNREKTQEINVTVKEQKNSHSFKLSDIIEKYDMPLLIGFLIVISLIVGFILSKEFTSRVFFVICILWLLLMGKDIISDFFPAIFGVALMSGMLYLGLIFGSYIIARGLYETGLMGPMTYSHIICDKVAGTFKTCRIKGNVGFESGEKIYHMPGCENYSKTVINRDFGESYFPSQKVAEKVGFRKCEDKAASSNYDTDVYDYALDYSDFYDDFMPRGGY